jgi:hypothetical protein
MTQSVVRWSLTSPFDFSRLLTPNSRADADAKNPLKALPPDGISGTHLKAAREGAEKLQEGVGGRTIGSVSTPYWRPTHSRHFWVAPGVVTIVKDRYGNVVDLEMIAKLARWGKAVHVIPHTVNHL